MSSSNNNSSGNSQESSSSLSSVVPSVVPPPQQEQQRPPPLSPAIRDDDNDDDDKETKKDDEKKYADDVLFVLSSALSEQRETCSLSSRELDDEQLKRILDHATTTTTTTINVDGDVDAIPITGSNSSTTLLSTSSSSSSFPSSSLPISFHFSVENLKYLDLSRNQIQSLPGIMISQFKSLTKLNLNRNHLKSLPIEIGYLTELVELSALSNHLKWNTIPLTEWSTQLLNLQILDLQYNPKIYQISIKESIQTQFELERKKKVEKEIGGSNGRTIILLDLRITPRKNKIIVSSSSSSSSSQKQQQQQQQQQRCHVSATDRDATLLRSQLEPISTPQLRKRLERTFGIQLVTTTTTSSANADADAVATAENERAHDRNYVMERLLAAYDDYFAAQEEKIVTNNNIQEEEVEVEEKEEELIPSSSPLVDDTSQQQQKEQPSSPLPSPHQLHDDTTTTTTTTTTSTTTPTTTLIPTTQNSPPPRRNRRRGRQIRHEQGIPIDPNVAQDLLHEMEQIAWPVTTRERPKVDADGYLILQKPPPPPPPPSSSSLSKNNNDDELNNNQNQNNNNTTTSTTTQNRFSSKRAIQEAKKLQKYNSIWNKAIQALETIDKQFIQTQFTALAVTKNFRGSPHIDTLNVAPFYGISFGNFVTKSSGGKLAVECSPLVVAEIDTYEKFAKVDGRFPHWVTEYVGTRYSLIYYVTYGTVIPQTTAIFKPPSSSLSVRSSSSLDDDDDDCDTAVAVWEPPEMFVL